MTTAAGGLKELHHLHIQLKEVQDQIDRGPLRIKATQKLVARKQAEVDELKEELTRLRMLADQKSLQLKTNEGKISDLAGKLNMASSNREFDIIKSQIEADTMANSVLEDEILEALDKVDEIKSRIIEIEQLLKEATAKEDTARKDVAAAEPELLAKKESTQESLTSAESILPGTISQAYHRLVSAHGAGALAPVRNKACSACYETFRPTMIVEINMAKFVFCKSCGRMVYRDDE